MTNEAELGELQQRIGRLSLSDQFRLFELILGAYRRQCEEVAAGAFAQFEARQEAEAGRADIVALEEWHARRQRMARLVEGTEREAG